MKRHLIAIALLAVLAAPASAQLSSQQQRMKDCNTQASGMTGDARKQVYEFLPQWVYCRGQKPNCVKGKPCGNSCIAKDEVCHK